MEEEEEEEFTVQSEIFKPTSTSDSSLVLSEFIFFNPLLEGCSKKLLFDRDGDLVLKRSSNSVITIGKSEYVVSAYHT